MGVLLRREAFFWRVAPANPVELALTFWVRITGNYCRIVFFNILNTSAVSSINLGSRLIFASCVIHLPLVCPTDVVRVNNVVATSPLS